MLTNHLVEKIKEYYDLKIKDHEVCYWGESLGEEIKKLAFIPSSDAHIGAISSIARAFREKKYRENSEYKKYKNDVIILFKGGHGFDVLEDCKIIEIKQGPYNKKSDKISFNDKKTNSSK